MASKSIQISISNSTFPELGTPINPVPAKDAKLSRADKADYKGFLSEVSIANSQISRIRTYYPSASIDQNNISLKVDYESGTSKTYKFLGMDVDEDFDAIIKLPQGHVIVGSMFDRDKVLEKFNRVSRNMTVDDSYINNLSIDAVRKMATGLKTGLAYDIISKNSGSSGSIDPKTLSSVFKSISDEIGVSNSGKPKFKSIILNLVHEKKEENQSIATNVTPDDILAKIAQSIIMYWTQELLPKYNSLYSLLADIDLWQDMGKRALGETEMTSRMSNCVKIIDNASGISDSTISISGVARNGSITDANVIRTASASGLEVVGETLGSNYPYKSVDDMHDLLAGFMDTESVGDVFSLSDSEMQALAVIDSLKYIDEDATLCADSYDMKDPEQRGLFVKSAIRSYERNFKEFKPANHYDVTESLAEMVEKGDIISKPVVSQSAATDDTEEDTVTSTVDEIDVTVNKSRLLKVMKLVYKTTSSILKGF